MALSTGENEKRQIASILKKRLIEGKNTITYRELLDQEMPLFLKNFLQNRVKKLYVTDEPIQFKNSKRYDYNYGRIKELQAELADLKNMRDSLLEQVDKLVQENNLLKKENQEFQATISDLNVVKSDLEKKVESGSVLAANNVFMLAYKEKSSTKRRNICKKITTSRI